MGSPTRRMPRGMRLPLARYFSGFLKKSTTSSSSTCTPRPPDPPRHASGREYYTLMTKHKSGLHFTRASV
eukprot:1180358-Prorocentrum_minimum.AAC.2